MLRRDFVAPGRAVFLAAALSFGAPPLHAQTTFVRIVPDRRIVLTADAGGRYLDVTVYFCSFPPDVYDIYSRVIEANSQNVTANFSEHLRSVWPLRRRQPRRM